MKGYNGWKNWETWEAYNMLCACDWDTYTAVCSLVADADGRSSRNDMARFKRLAADWISEYRPEIDLRRVDWAALFNAVAELA